jgi:hypothetical protein
VATEQTESVKRPLRSAGNGSLDRPHNAMSLMCLASGSSNRILLSEIGATNCPYSRSYSVCQTALHALLGLDL